MAKPRINRRIAVPVQNDVVIWTEPTGLLVFFRDGHGEPLQRFDLSKLGIPPDIAQLLATSFRGLDSGRAEATRLARWGALRTFASFIKEDGRVRGLGDIETDTLRRFVTWLGQRAGRNGKSWTPSTCATQFTLVKALFAWAQRYRPAALPVDLGFPYDPFPGAQKLQKQRARLPEAQLKAILRACYEDIDYAWKRFTRGQEIVASPDLPPKVPTGEGFARQLWRMHRSNGGILPKYTEFAEKGLCHWASLRLWGWRQGVSEYLHLTTSTLVPFYLAIAVQTAANPDALRLISRDCLIPHPLDEHRTVITWIKGRAGGLRKRAQRRAFDKRKVYAAPNLIEKVLAMTAPLVPHARPEDRECLFLVNTGGMGRRRRREGATGVIDESTLRNAIERYIVRVNKRIEAWNDSNPGKPRSLLPKFAAAFLRGSVATEHYKAAGGDILAAKALLNHADVSTTETYIKGEETRRLQAETIARLQRLMIAWIGGGETVSGDGGPPPSAATASFSHTCLKPFIENGRLCPRFGGCLNCPGLVVPLDAEHLARILQAKRQLEAARDRLDSHRWASIYAPSYRVLVADLLPDFASGLYPDAERIIPALPALPELE